MQPLPAHAREAHFFSMEHLHVIIKHLPIIGLAMAILALALAVLCEGAGGWIALAGGQIRHPEFRSEAPPATDPESKHMH